MSYSDERRRRNLPNAASRPRARGYSGEYPASTHPGAAEAHTPPPAPPGNQPPPDPMTSQLPPPRQPGVPHTQPQQIQQPPAQVVANPQVPQQQQAAQIQLASQTAQVQAQPQPQPATVHPQPAHDPPPAPVPEEIPEPIPAQTEPAKTSLQQSLVSIIKEEEPAKPETLEFVSGSADVSPKEILLHTEDLVKIYDGRTVVNGVNINVKKGEIVGLLGPNGAGKTTSFYMIVGLVPPNSGKVMFDGKDMTKLPMYKRARLGMGYLPQEESIFRKLTVEENIMAVMQTMKYSRKEKKARCEELLERFSITHIRKNIAMACSGGEKRRVTIARSLVPNPSLIMLDEPFAGVDPIAVGEIHSIVQDLRKDGLAILITDHNAQQTLDLVDRAYLICEGRVLREGPKDFLINDPVSREIYFGDRFEVG